MSAAVLLGRLDKVRAAGAGRWMAACPAHEDKSPSLSIRELDNGRVLVHDFAGCPAADVLAAVGLSLSDLFPDRPADHRSRPARDRHHQHAAVAALKTLHREVLVCAIAAEHVAAGVALDEADRERLMQSATAIRSAAEVCGAVKNEWPVSAPRATERGGE